MTHGEEKQSTDGQDDARREFSCSNDAVASKVRRCPVVLHHSPEEDDEHEPGRELIGAFLHESSIEIRAEEEQKGNDAG